MPTVSMASDPLADSGMVTRGDVISAFKLLLEREPESEDIVSAFCGLNSLTELRQAIMAAPEYVMKSIGTDVHAVPLVNFSHIHTVRMTARRQEHLATLGLPVHGRSVLEIGAGIGFHSTFFLDRGCKVLATDGRSENMNTMKAMYEAYRWYPAHANLEFAQLDIENVADGDIAPRDIVYSYGLLYHCANPDIAIRNMSSLCSHLLLLETGVSIGQYDQLNIGSEAASNVSQSIHGGGSHPTREWIFDTLKGHFAHVYCPTTQPRHEFFPIDWSAPKRFESQTIRTTFVASREPLSNPFLAEEVPQQQTYAP